MPGWDQGSTSLAWITPPFPQLVSMAASGWRSTSTTSWPDFLRYQAVAVPTAPAPRTTVVMARPFPSASTVLRFLVRSALAPGAFRRLVRLVPNPGPGDPHGFPFSLDPAGDVAGDVTQNLVR